FVLHRTAPPYGTPLSLHDALPISLQRRADQRDQRLLPHVLGLGAEAAPDEPGLHRGVVLAAQRVERRGVAALRGVHQGPARLRQDRKSTRLNSSHVESSYAVFCLK